MATATAANTAIGVRLRRATSILASLVVLIRFSLVVRICSVGLINRMLGVPNRSDKSSESFLRRANSEHLNDATHPVLQMSLDAALDEPLALLTKGDDDLAALTNGSWTNFTGGFS